MKNKISILFFFCITYSFAQLNVGDRMPAFNLQSSENIEFSSESLNGNWVLIDFWASWCAPCRVANKKLVNLHKSISNDKFEIIGISLDKKLDSWKKAIEKDKIKYTQIIDPNGFDAKTAIDFGIDELPTTYLFNTKGELVKINPTEEEILFLIK
jgi:peroxiredoxin